MIQLGLLFAALSWSGLSFLKLLLTLSAKGLMNKYEMDSYTSILVDLPYGPELAQVCYLWVFSRLCFESEYFL